MIGAHEAFGVAVVAAHHAVAAVAAHVQQRVQLALPVAGQDDRVLAHVGVEVIVGRGHQALVPDHQPGAPEDFLHLVVVDRLIAEDAAVDFAGGGVDDGVLLSGAHARILAIADRITGAGADHKGFGAGRAAAGRQASTLAVIPRRHAEHIRSDEFELLSSGKRLGFSPPRRSTKLVLPGRKP